MQYKLYPNSLNDLSKIRETVFQNRCYLPPGYKNCISSYNKLLNMQSAVELFDKHKDGRICVVVDSDVDGFCSGSILVKYIQDNFSETQVTYLLHSEKKHGLSNDIDWQSVGCDLLILPDSGTNDVEQCKFLHEKCIDILILDHHIIEEENPYAIVVNSNDGTYPNTELCGTGVTWQFLRALDDEYWFEDSDNYIQQAAIATIADIMDVTVPENRQLIDIGLSDISHPLFVALADKANTPLQSITGIDVQFGIVPLMNALIRVGSMEEKELLFKALLCKEEYFNYQKRGTDEVIEESIYDRVARLCYNAKSRQKRSNSNSIDSLLEQIESKGLNENKVLVVNGTKTVEQALTGMVAAQLANKFNKPCLVLRKRSDETYGGSGRNSTCSVVSNFREALEQTGLFNFVSGHDNSFGVEIQKDNIPKMITMLNENLPDDVQNGYYVDFIQDGEMLDFDTVALVSKQVRQYIGEGFQDVAFVFEHIPVTKNMVQTMGKNAPSWKITLDNDVTVAKFNVPYEDPLLMWYNDVLDDDIEITIYCTLGFNYWAGMVTAQAIVKDYEIL